MTAAAIQVPPKTIALIGNPNCGKTTLFNALTGLSYKVANYAGTTVEKREGQINIESSEPVILLDLPGTYSTQGSSRDEEIVSEVLSGKLLASGRPDLILAVVDATNLERNLLLVSQLIDLDYSVVLAVNMMDEARKSGIKVLDELLSRSLDLPVVPIVARQKIGIDSVRNALASALSKPCRSKKAFAWAPDDSPRTGIDPRRQTILRHKWVRQIANNCSRRSDIGSSSRRASVDVILMHKVWGLLILAALFACMFQAIFLGAAYPMDAIGSAVEWLAGLTKQSLPSGILADLLSDGIIVGVGNVLVFLPQIAILFLFLGLLEDCGYLARAVFLLDNVMRKFGLQGRSFVPLLSSFACAVPGILATRTIASKSDRFATIMVAPLMSCSARLPVYAVLIAAFIPAHVFFGIVSLQGLVLLGLYLLGIISACVVSWVLKFTILESAPSLLVMEVPPLRLPTFQVVLRGVYDRAMSFVRNATSIILACSILVWFLASFPKVPDGYNGNPVQYSYAGRLGTAIEPLIEPLGFNWELGFAIISSFPAREVFVTSLTTVYNLQEDSTDDDHHTLISALENRRKEGSFSLLTAFSLLVFYVFACQCMSTLAVVRRETNSWAWTGGMFAYMTALAYLGAFATYQIGRLVIGA